MAGNDGKPKLGFVGLGVMGVPMVQRLLECGYAVTVWNREPERANLVMGEGAVRADSPKAVREASDVVMFCVLDGDAVEQCCFGDNGIARAGGGATVLIDFSTINPDRTRDLAERLKREARMAWIDAPVSGGPPAAREGQLTIMAGGDQPLFEKVRGLLDALGTNVTRMGPLGAGQVTKIVNQAIVGVNYVLMAEVLALAEASGIDAAVLPQCLKGGAADSTILQKIYKQMQARDFDPPRAYARQLDKDLKNLAGFADELSLDLPIVKAAVARYGAYVAAGNDMADSASIARAYEKQVEKA